MSLARFGILFQLWGLLEGGDGIGDNFIGEVATSQNCFISLILNSIFSSKLSLNFIMSSVDFSCLFTFSRLLSADISCLLSFSFSTIIAASSSPVRSSSSAFASSSSSFLSSIKSYVLKICFSVNIVLPNS